jgi:hypothetical protein
MADCLYVTGTFNDSIFEVYNSDGTLSGISLNNTSNNVPDSFIVKYNANGFAQWGVVMGGNSTSSGYSISVDSSSNLYVTGFFSDTTFELYNSDGTLSGISLNNTSTYVYDSFIVKYNANGFAQWGVVMGGTNGSNGHGISVDSFGNLYVTGFFSDTIFEVYNSDGTLSGISLNNNGTNVPDAFIIKYNSNGFAQWGVVMGGTYSSFGSSISVDSFGNLYVTGYFADTTFELYNSDGTLSGISLNNTGTNVPDAFIVKYNSNGFAQWGVVMGGNIESTGSSISVDSFGNLYVTGYFADTTFELYNSDGTLSGISLNNTGTNFQDAFIVKYNANGFAQWGVVMGGNILPPNDTGFGICVYKFAPNILPILPISNICFLSNTPVVTNQGIVLIEKLDPNIHTINNKRIVAITKTLTFDKYLICFEKNSLDHYKPRKDTYMTKDHRVYYNGKSMKAIEFVGKYPGVKKVKYNGEILYNILMDKYEKITVNNLICETLHPKNPIAKLYNDKNLTYEKRCIKKTL